MTREPKKREVNIEGIKYSRLKAVRRVKIEHIDTKKPLWLFKCDCGKEKILHKQNVTNGTTKSCGCLHSEMMSSQIWLDSWRSKKKEAASLIDKLRAENEKLKEQLEIAINGLKIIERCNCDGYVFPIKGEDGITTDEFAMNILTELGQ